MWLHRRLHGSTCPASGQLLKFFCSSYRAWLVHFGGVQEELSLNRTMAYRYAFAVVLLMAYAQAKDEAFISRSTSSAATQCVEDADCTGNALVLAPRGMTGTGGLRRLPGRSRRRQQGFGQRRRRQQGTEQRRRTGLRGARRRVHTFSGFLGTASVTSRVPSYDCLSMGPHAGIAERNEVR